MISSMIDNHLIQCPVNKLDKDISKFIEEAATNLDIANMLIQNKFNQNWKSIRLYESKNKIHITIL